jgi:hypothetical protein
VTYSTSHIDVKRTLPREVPLRLLDASSRLRVSQGPTVERGSRSTLQASLAPAHNLRRSQAPRAFGDRRDLEPDDDSIITPSGGGG